MGDEQDGDAERLLQCLHLPLHLLTQTLVQRGHRLVQQQGRRVEDQGAGQCDPLLLAAGQLTRAAVAEPGQPTRLSASSARLRRSVRRDPAHAQREIDVLGGAHVREQGVILEDHAEVAVFRRQAVHGFAVDQHRDRR